MEKTLASGFHRYLSNHTAYLDHGDRWNGNRKFDHRFSSLNDLRGIFLFDLFHDHLDLHVYRW